MTISIGVRRLNTSQVCRRLGVSRKTIDRWIRTKDFPTSHYLGNQRRWFLHEIEVWERKEMSRPQREFKNLKRRAPQSPAPPVEGGQEGAP